MTEAAAPLVSGLQIAGVVVYAVFVWWFSTGLLLALVRVPRALHPWIMAAMTLLTAGAIFGMAATGFHTSVASAIAAFTYAILIWAWLELSFLYGYLTGPSRASLAPGTVGFARFRAALATIAYHEVGILLALVGVVLVTLDRPNQVGALAFLVLFAMRISAKLNLFFGAPNLSPEFLPRHLDHLASYFEVSRVSRFFPVSVTFASLGFGFTVHAALTATDAHHLVAMTLVATLLGLAILEHWFLVLPVRDAALWRWALGGRPVPVAAPPPPRGERAGVPASPAWRAANDEGRR
jgi:putative photosynthetic complex assembly protein 2